jgi:hypothetical protein
VQWRNDGEEEESAAGFGDDRHSAFALAGFIG